MIRGLLALAAGSLLAGCGNPAPRPLVEGRDLCQHCHMTVVERRFGGELVTTTGKVLPFDDVGCLAIGTLAVEPGRIHSLWAVDFLEPDSMVAVEQMVYLRSSGVRTPMSHGIVAVRPGPAADSLAAAIGATRLDWTAVIAWARDSAGR